VRPHRIVDTHQHFWDLSLNYYPWLSDKVVVKPYGDYAAIRKTYVKADFAADIGDLPVVKSVHIDAGHDPGDPVRETRWLQQLADARGPLGGFPHGIVADGNLTEPDVVEILEAQCAFANMRGLRGMLSDSVRYPGQKPELLDSETWRHNVSLLASRSLSLDLQLYPVQMVRVAELARQNPELSIIVCHTGSPVADGAGWFERWRLGMRGLAACPNVALKISGLGLFDQAWGRVGKSDVIQEAIEIFGAERCMFGSDFPVDSLFSSYRDLWEVFFDATKALTAMEIDNLYYANAVRLYRL